MLYNLTQRDPAILHQVPASGTSSGYGPLMGSRLTRPPDNVGVLLAPYRRHTIATNQG